MKRLAGMALLLFTLTAATPAGAQVFGQFIPAHPLAGGNSLFGAYLLLGDNNVGVLGQARFSVDEKLHWGLQAGFSDDPGSGAVLVGGDVQYSLKRADEQFPLDLAFDGAAGFSIADNITVFEVGPQLHYSHRFPLEGSPGALTPYGSLFLDINHVSVDPPGPGLSGVSDTDSDLVARFGLEWEINRKFMWSGELEVGRGTNFSTGVNIPF